MIRNIILKINVPALMFQEQACFAAVVYQTEAKNVQFICALNATACLDKANYVSGVTWTFFEGTDDLSATLSKQDYCVIASDDSEEIPTMFIASTKCHRANIILRYPTNVVPQWAELKRLFDEAWKLGIIDIVVVATSSSNCLVFSYNPFKEFGVCYDTSPELINSWKRDITPKRSVNYFPENKISTLRSCKLVFEHYQNDTDILWYWRPLLEILEVALNATRQMFFRPDIYFDTPKSDGNSSRVVLSYYKADYEVSEFFVIPLFFYLAHIVLALPHQPVSSLQWSRLLNELSVYVWYGVGVSIIVTVVFMYASMKGSKDLMRVVTFCLRTLLASPTSPLRLRGFARLYLAQWLLFCLVLDATYHSKLLSKLTVPLSDESIKSIEDFIRSPLVLYFPETDADFIKLAVLQEPRFQGLQDKAVFVNRTYRDMVDPNRQDIAYIVFQSDFESLFINKTYYSLADPVFVRQTALPIRLTKPSPYERFFKIAVMRATEVGAFVFVRRKARHDKSMSLWRDKISGQVKPLLLKPLSTLFIIWLAGCSISFGAFLLERCFADRVLHEPEIKHTPIGLN